MDFPLLRIQDYPGLSQSSVKGSRLETHIMVVGYRLNCLDEPVFVAVPMPMQTQCGTHNRLKSCVWLSGFSNAA